MRMVNILHTPRERAKGQRAEGRVAGTYRGYRSAAASAACRFSPAVVAFFIFYFFKPYLVAFSPSAVIAFKFYPLMPRRHLLLSIATKVSKNALWFYEKTGSPKSPIGFLGRRKHNGAVSFSARKTMSGVCADDAVAVNFSVLSAFITVDISPLIPPP